MSDVGQKVALVGLIGVGGYIVFTLLKGKDEFGNLVAVYDGQAPGSNVPKNPGDSVTVGFTFDHKGPGGEFDIGIGLAPAESIFGVLGPVQQWIYQALPVSKDSDWTTQTVSMTGVIPLSITQGKKDGLKWIQSKGGARRVDGSGFKIADWDKDCYEMMTGGIGFQNFQGTYS